MDKMNIDSTHGLQGYRNVESSSRNRSHDTTDSDSTVYAGEKSDENSVHFDSLLNPPTPAVSSSLLKSGGKSQTEHLTDAVERGRALFGSPISFYDANKQRSHLDALRSAVKHDTDMANFSSASFLEPPSMRYGESTPLQRPLVFRGEMSAPARHLSAQPQSRIPVRSSLQPSAPENVPIAHGLAQNAALVVDALRSAQVTVTDSPSLSIAEKMRQLRLTSASNLADTKGGSFQRDTMEVTPIGTITRPRSAALTNAGTNGSARSQNFSQTATNSSVTGSSSFNLLSTHNSENDDSMARGDRMNDSQSMRRAASFRNQGDTALPPLPVPSARRSESRLADAQNLGDSLSASKRNESVNSSVDLMKYMTHSQPQPQSQRDQNTDADESAFHLSDVLASPSNVSGGATHSRSEMESAMRSYRLELQHQGANDVEALQNDEEVEEAPPIKLTNEEVAALLDSEFDDDVEEAGSDGLEREEHPTERGVTDTPDRAEPERQVALQTPVSRTSTTGTLVASENNAAASQKDAAPYSFRGISLSTESLLRELEDEELSVSRQIDASAKPAANNSKVDYPTHSAVASTNAPASASNSVLSSRTTAASPRATVERVDSPKAASPLPAPSKAKVSSVKREEPVSISEYFRLRSAPLGKLLNDATPTFGLSHSAILTPSRSTFVQESQLSMQASPGVGAGATFVLQNSSSNRALPPVPTNAEVHTNANTNADIGSDGLDDTISSVGRSTNSKLNITDDNNNETLQSNATGSLADEPDDDAISLSTNRLVRRLLTESKLNELLAINARDANSTLIEGDIVDYLARISSLQNATATVSPPRRAPENPERATLVSSPQQHLTPTPNKPPIAPANSGSGTRQSRPSVLAITPDTSSRSTKTPVLPHSGREAASAAVSSARGTGNDSRPSVRSSTPSGNRERDMRHRSASSSSADRTATSSSSNMLTTITPASSSGTIDTLKLATTAKPDSAFHESPTTAMTTSVDSRVSQAARRDSVSFAKRVLFGRTRVGALASQTWLIRNDTFDWLSIALEPVSSNESSANANTFLLESAFVLEPRSSKAQRVVFAPHTDGVTSCEYDVLVRLLDDVHTGQLVRERLLLTGTAESVRVQLSLAHDEASVPSPASVLDFGALHWNAKTSREVTLTNLCGLPVPLALRIVRDAGDCFVDDETFTFGNEATSKLCQLEPFARTTVRIRCSAPGSRSELLACRARLLVLVADENDEQKNAQSQVLADVSIRAAFGSAKLHIEGAIDSLRFDAQARDDPQVRSFKLFNVGTIPATVALCVLEDARSLFDISPRVLRLAFDAHEQVRVTMRRGELDTRARADDDALYQARVLLSVEPDGPQYTVGLRVLDKLMSSGGSLKNEIRNDRQSEPRSRVSDPLRKADTTQKPPMETGCLLSSRQVVEFGGVQLGAVTRERIVLKNSHPSLTLHLSLKIDCLPEANFAIEIESHGSGHSQSPNAVPSTRSHSTGHGRAVATANANLVLEPQQLKSVYVSFAPARCISVSGKLSIRAQEFKQKYSIPLSAYGGVSWLTVTDGNTDTLSVSEGDRPEGANLLTLTRDSDRADCWRGFLSLKNSGWRAAFVRLLPTVKPDALATTILSSDVERETVVRVAPCSQFVLLTNQSRPLQVEVQLLGDLGKRLRAARELPSGQHASLLLGKFLLLSGDEILRQRVRRSLKTGSQNSSAFAKRSQLAGMLSAQYPLNEFDATCDGELLCNEQALAEGESDTVMFYERLRLIELNVYLNLASPRNRVSVSLSQSQSHAISITTSRESTPTRKTPANTSGTRPVTATPHATPTKTLVSSSPSRAVPAPFVEPLNSAQRNPVPVRIPSSISGRSTSSYVSHSDSATIHVDASENDQTALSTSNSNLTGFTNYTDLTSVSEMRPGISVEDGEHRQLEHKLSLDRKLVDFGRVLPNEQKEALFKFSNKADEPVCMRIWISDPARFAIAGTKIRVQPKHYVLPRVTFQSSKSGTFHALLMLTNVDRPQEYLTLRLQAECE